MQQLHSQNQAVILLNFTFESLIISFFSQNLFRLVSIKLLRSSRYIFLFLFFWLHHLCNISVLILYTQNKQQFPSVLFVFMLCRCLFILLWPLSFFAQWLSVWLYSWEEQSWSSVECLLSDFACNVIDVRLSSAHCITNQCYHGELKCNHVQKCRLVLLVWVILLSGKRFRWKISSFSHFRILYLLTLFTTKRGMCVYIF